jgi:hypothetical protein
MVIIISGRKRIHKEQRKGIDSLVVSVCWLIWKERNGRILNNAMLQAAQLSSWIREEGQQWTAAGYSLLSDFIQ